MKRRSLEEIWKDGKKSCSVCRVLKEYSEFGKQAGCRNGLKPACRACCAKRDKANQKKHAYSYRAMIKKLYGITYKQYKSMLENQDYKCAICGNKQRNKRLSVDHCHKTGNVRGLLCGHCNSVLGNARDDIVILKRSIRYLKERIA